MFYQKKSGGRYIGQKEYFFGIRFITESQRKVHEKNNRVFFLSPDRRGRYMGRNSFVFDVFSIKKSRGNLISFSGALRAPDFFSVQHYFYFFLLSPNRSGRYMKKIIRALAGNQKIFFSSRSGNQNPEVHEKIKITLCNSLYMVGRRR